MKLKKLSLILILGLIIVLSAKAGICADEIAQHVPAAAEAIPAKEPAGLSNTMIKFIITMAGVVLSSVVIWLGLTIYNKFFVKSSLKSGELPEDTLNTPKTIEEAVTFFIKKNRLK